MRIVSGLLLLLANGVSLCTPPTRGFGVRRALFSVAGLSIAKSAKLCSGTRFDNKYVSVGDQSWIGGGGRIIAGPTSYISIGRECNIGPQVMMVTGSHKIGPELCRAGAGYSLPIIVADGVWIGARSTVLGGVTIGRGSVVAAGAVVTGNVRENTMVGGVPARFLRELSVG